MGFNVATISFAPANRKTDVSHTTAGSSTPQWKTKEIQSPVTGYWFARGRWTFAPVAAQGTGNASKLTLGPGTAKDDLELQKVIGMQLQVVVEFGDGRTACLPVNLTA